MSRSPITFFDAASDNVFLGLEFGMDKARVTRVLGEPEDWTERDPLVLRYGDLQTTFDGDHLWLITLWIIDDKIQIEGKDHFTTWRLSEEEVTNFFASRVGTPTTDDFGVHFKGALLQAHAIFDDDRRLTKLSLSSHPRPAE